MFRKYYNTGVCIAAALLLVPQHVAGQSMVLDSGRVVNTTTGEVTGSVSPSAAGQFNNTGPSFNNSVAFNPNPTQGDFNAGTTANIVSSLMGGGGGVGCIDGSGNPIASILGAGIGNALGGQVGSLASSLVGNALGDQLQSITGSLLNTALNGGIAALTGGLLAGVVGGDVKVFDKQNNKVAIEQVKLLQQILTVQNITCATQQQILAAIGVAGPANGTSNPMVNLPVYAGKVFAMYRDTTQTATPQTVANLNQSSGGAVVIPNNGLVQAGGPDIKGIAQNALNGAGIGNLGNLGNLGQLTGLNNILQNAQQALNNVVGDINNIFGGLPTFTNQTQELDAVIMNIIGGTGNPGLQGILNTALGQKGIDDIIQTAIGQTPGAGQFDVLNPAQIARVMTEMLYVDDATCTDINECLKTTGVIRQTLGATIPANTFAKSAARSQNLQEEVRQLVYGVDDAECPANTTDKKCVSLLRMMTASSSLREDIQTNTAAVLTAMSFQLKELEALSEANINQAAPNVLTGPAIVASDNSGDGGS